MGDTPESGAEISSFKNDSAEIETATTTARNISHWYPWTAIPRLKVVEATREQLETRVNKSLAKFQSRVTQPLWSWRFTEPKEVRRSRRRSK